MLSNSDVERTFPDMASVAMHATSPSQVPSVCNEAADLGGEYDISPSPTHVYYDSVCHM
jgi:hypothetical protein